ALRGRIVLFNGGRQGFAAPAFTAAVSGAAAIVRVAGTSLSPTQLRAATWPTANMLLRSGAPSETPLTILVTQRAAETLLGAPVAQATVGAPGKVVHGAIAFAESPAPARNVVAILPGSDPKLRGTYVAL